MSTDINISSFDREPLKRSLIEFVRTKGVFKDFDFEGSGINTIIDLLVQNDMMLAFLANMTSNEAFMDSAQKRQNVVSHAFKMGYVPRSMTSAKMVVDVFVSASSHKTPAPTLVMDRGAQFIGSIDNKTFVFTNATQYNASYDVTKNGYTFPNVELHQGYLTTASFTYNQSGQSVPISNANADTSTLDVSVSNSSSSKGIDHFSNAESVFSVGALDRVFYLRENRSTLYEVYFGRDLFGKEPTVGSKIFVAYVTAQDFHANGVTDLIPATPIGGLSSVRIDVKVPSYGGADREGIEEIRFNAPRAQQIQNRAVTNQDYEKIIERKFPFIKKAIAWGGETADIPQYGKVLISALPYNGDSIPNSIKKDIINEISVCNVGTVSVEIVDPDVIGLEVMVLFGVDSAHTLKNTSELSGDIKAAVVDFNAANMRNFGAYFNQAKVMRAILDVDGVESVDIQKRAIKTLHRISPSGANYDAVFDNPLQPGSIFITGLVKAEDVESISVRDVDGVLVQTIHFRDETSFTKNVGTVDYKKGTLTFFMEGALLERDFYVYAVPTNTNFFTKHNRIAYISKVETGAM